MGTNIHALAHRLTALSMACLASAAFVFCILSGFGCSFVRITALEGRSIGNAHGEEFEGLDVAHLGVQCLSGSDALFYPPSDDNGGDNGDGDADGGTGSMNTSTYTNTYTYSEGGDRLWRLSKLFLCIGLSLGGATTAFAWLLTSCVRPTAARWRILSVLAACAAVFQIPIFLVFESDNCNFDVFRQSCALSTSAYLNVVSVSIWIVTTIWVQCLRAPRWDEELDAWRVDGMGTGTGTRTGSSSSSHYGRDKGHGHGHGHGQGHGHPGEIYCDGNGNGNGNRNGNSNGNGNSNSNSNSNSNENDTVETTKNDGDLENQQRVPHAYGNANGNGNGNGNGNELRGAFPEHALQQQQHSWRGNTNTNMGHRTSAPTNAMKRNLKQGSRSRNVGARIEPEPTTAATAGKPSFLKSLIKNNIPKLQISRSPKRQSQSSPPLRAVTEGVHHPYRHHPRHHHQHQHQQQQQQQRPEQLPSPNRATDAVASKRTSLDTTGAVDASTSMGNTNSTRNHTVDRSRSHDKTQTVATGGTSNTGTGMGTSIGTGTGTDTSKNKNKKRATTPGFHISCVYRDGSHREAHFPSVATCCLGMGVPLEEDEKEDTRFKSFPHVSDDFRMVGYDEGDDDNDGNGNDGYDDYDDYDYDDYDDRNHSGNSDFLVRKLKREEEAAAGRRSGRSSKTEKAPVASLKFVTNTSTSTGIDRRNKSKNNNNNNKNNTNNNYGSEYENDGIIGADDDAANIHYDDVSEMTRGSGWASGVSEILDDTDLRHQPRAILDELRNMY